MTGVARRDKEHTRHNRTLILADHSLTDELVVGGSFNDADELVPDRSFESSVAPRNFQICATDSGKEYSHERLGPAFR
jgi:hypothetical protein